MSDKPDFYFDSSTERLANQNKVSPGQTAGERDSGNIYKRTTSGWLQAGIDLSSKTSGLYNTDGTYPKTQAVTGDPKHLNDVLAYALHSTQGVVVEADITTYTYTAGMNVTGFTLHAWGGAAFKGYYYTVNAASLADAAVRLRSLKANASTLRGFAPANKTVFPKYAEEITRLDFVAIDTDGTEDNNGELVPF